jgi:predicted Zn-dependent protease
VKTWGAKSGFGRDPRLYHYLNGLLWLARDRPDSAVIAFRLALLSETQGYSRLNLQLARALLMVGRADEAIPLLKHALAGTLEAGNFYVARTELQETLARAYEGAGSPDSAAVYYRAVLRAWRHADPQFQPAMSRARARLAIDERLLATRH